eukprot:TRINITY_DN12401_c0_g1_i1.p1 TRINITY_DN12401_c0_g1~~TRINITY_DN12401_c0_g1_i1.p1  ORF type:complete len:354 (+),score=89.26 TRINITY_DN12401_c0_g1_i1:19-1080(+)
MAEEDQVVGICVSCKEPITPFMTHWKCSQCASVYMCEDCVLNEETHKHPMNKVKGERRELVHFEYQDKKKTGNTLYLSEFTCAIPGSATIRDKDIKSVLSVMDFDGGGDGLKDLRTVFHKPGVYTQTTRTQGVVYHNVAVPDYRDPAKLSTTTYNLVTLLCETTVFIDEALKHGNVLLHCQMGQRRSPTILIAWLITRGMQVDKAIDYISERYVNQRDWARGYRKERAKWVTKLQMWKRKYSQLRKYWKDTNKTMTQLWQELCGEEDGSASENEEPKKIKDKEVDSDSDSEGSNEDEDEKEKEKDSDNSAEEENNVDEKAGKKKQVSLADAFKSTNKRKREEEDTTPSKKLKK